MHTFPFLKHSFFLSQIIDSIGEWGPWQLRHVCTLGAMTLFSAVPSLIIKFMAAPTEFVCADPFKVLFCIPPCENKNPV